MAAKARWWWYASAAEAGHTALPAEQWRTLLTQAVSGGKLRLAFYPVVGSHNQTAIHQEGMIRLQLDTAGTLLSAGDFMPMAARLNLTAPIDLQVVKLAIEYLRTTPGDIAINLSAETIVDFNFRCELALLLQANPDVCRRLLFEVPEYGVFKQFDAFRDLVRSVKPLGCRVGIEYFGQRFAEGDKLADLGLDYIKVHPSYVHGIANSPGNQEFLKGLCSVARNFGIVVIALGVWYALDPKLVLSVIAVESNFNTVAQSPKAAMGLMQLIPDTAERFNVRNAFDATQNLRGGMRYMRWLLSYYRGNISYALAAYNAGEGRVDRYRGVPPFPETRAYVKRVIGLYGSGHHAFDADLTAASPMLAGKNR